MIILYMDDDREDIAFFREALGPIHHCVFVENGQQGLDVLETIALPDYIFLDINMPVMNGKETLQAIRSDSRFNEIPVIMLSTALSPSDVQELTRSGATKCLVKPISPNQLRQDLYRILGEPLP